MAELLARPSEIVLAYAALGRVAAGQEDRATLKQLRAELRNRTSNQVSRMAQDAALVITELDSVRIAARGIDNQTPKRRCFCR